MKSDVKALVESLTTERNRIDRAIAALKAMDGSESVAPQAAKRAKRKGGVRGLAISQSMKETIVQRMHTVTSGGLREAATELGRIYGISPMTIYTSWQRWAKSGNGTMAVESQPATTTTAVAVQ